MRRLRADFMGFFKILKGSVDLYLWFFERAPLDFVTRGHRIKLVYPNVQISVNKISLQFELLQFGIFFRQTLLRQSQFLVSMRVFSNKSYKIYKYLILFLLLFLYFFAIFSVAFKVFIIFTRIKASSPLNRRPRYPSVRITCTILY